MIASNVPFILDWYSLEPRLLSLVVLENGVADWVPTSARTPVIFSEMLKCILILIGIVIELLSEYHEKLIECDQV